MDIEAELVSLLSTHTSVTAGTRVPNPVPSEFIHIRRHGGSAALESGGMDEIFQDSALIDIYVSAPDEGRAYEIASLVRRYMLSLLRNQPFSRLCYRVSEDKLTWADDDLDGVFTSPRVWLSYDVSVRFT